MAFIFEWNSTDEDAVAEVDQARAGVLLDDLLRACRGRRGVAPRPRYGIVSNGPSSQPNPQRIALSMSARSCAICGATRLRVVERRNERRAKESSDLVVALDERADSLADVCRCFVRRRARASRAGCFGRYSIDAGSSVRISPSAAFL